MPTVSVIIPNYNYARYLEGRIGSVLDQTFKDYELILLDDASTDESADILQRYKDLPQVSHLVVNEQNTGSPFKQWFKGIALARGKYVWIAEADDLADPDFLRTCVQRAEERSDTAIAYVGSRLIDADGTVSRKDINRWGKKRAAYRTFDGREYAERNLYWKNYTVNASGILFRREYALRLLDSTVGRLRYCGDWLFWFEMALQGSVTEIHRDLNYWRQHDAKVTVASHGNGAGILEDMVIIREMEQHLRLDRHRKRLRRGLLYRKAKRQNLPPEQREKLFAQLEEGLGATAKDYDYYRLNNVLKCFVPTLTTPKRERMK